MKHTSSRLPADNAKFHRKKVAAALQLRTVSGLQRLLTEYNPNEVKLLRDELLLQPLVKGRMVHFEFIMATITDLESELAPSRRYINKKLLNNNTQVTPLFLAVWLVGTVYYGTQELAIAKVRLMMQAGACPIGTPFGLPKHFRLQDFSKWTGWHTPMTFILSSTEISDDVAEELFAIALKHGANIHVHAPGGARPILPCNERRMLMYANAGGSLGQPNGKYSTIVGYTMEHFDPEGCNNSTTERMIELCMRLGAPVHYGGIATIYDNSTFENAARRHLYPDSRPLLIAAVRCNPKIKRLATTLCLVQKTCSNHAFSRVSTDLLFSILSYVIQVDYTKYYWQNRLSVLKNLFE